MINLSHPLRFLAILVAKHASRPLIIGLRREFGHIPTDRPKAEKLGRGPIRQALSEGRRVVLDLDGVDVATQSFFNSLMKPALADRPDWIERVMVRNASESDLAAIELAMTFLIRDHNRSRRVIEPRIRRYEDMVKA
jgi:hypothetical protein